MSAFFVLQFAAYGLSLLLLTRAVNRRLTRACAWLDPHYLPCIAWGWCVYLLPYLISAWLAAPVEVVWGLYAGLAVGTPIIATAHRLWRHRFAFPTVARAPGCERWTLLLVAGFVGGMIYVGPYLEFPSDPVDYLYRVQAWEKVRTMDYAGAHQIKGIPTARFASFLEHWLLRDSGISLGAREGLGLVSAVTQGLLFWQFARLATLLTGRAVWGWLAGALSLGYFGYATLSFYRYVVFSGPMVSYIVYLEGLILIVAAFSKQDWRYFLLLPPVMLLCWMNHEQGTLFLVNALIGVAVALLLFRYRALTRPFRRILLGGVVTAGALALGLAIRWPPVVPKADWEAYYVTPLGTVFGWQLTYHTVLMLDEMIGAVGWAAMIAAGAVLLLPRRDPGLDIMAAVTLWPLAVLWNPVGVDVLARFTYVDLIHRLLYGSLYWVLPVVLLSHVAERLDQGRRAGAGSRAVFRYLAVSALVGLTMASWLARPPIRGRLKHVVLPVRPELDGANLQPLIRYLRANAGSCVDPHPDPRYRPIRRYVLSDTYVNTYLLATGYFYTATSRREAVGHESPPLGLQLPLDGALDQAAFLSILRERSVCYVVLYRPTAPVWSWAGTTSGHWRSDHADTTRYYSARFVQWVDDPRHFELTFEDGPVRVYRLRTVVGRIE
jgi:hypothetical protein